MESKGYELYSLFGCCFVPSYPFFVCLPFVSMQVLQHTEQKEDRDGSTYTSQTTTESKATSPLPALSLLRPCDTITASSNSQLTIPHDTPLSSSNKPMQKREEEAFAHSSIPKGLPPHNAISPIIMFCSPFLVRSQPSTLPSHHFKLCYILKLN